MEDTADGIWDDGEWISWDWINGQLDDQALRKKFPDAEIEVVKIFEELVSLAESYRELTGRYLQIWGELGELYAEITYGLVRHRPGTKGSDGRIGDDWVEVKTISPEKGGGTVGVKTAGNFNKLLVVRISDTFEFQSRLVDRKTLDNRRGKNAKYRWEDEPRGGA